MVGRFRPQRAPCHVSLRECSLALSWRMPSVQLNSQVPVVVVVVETVVVPESVVP
jgi:hypothetical protein